MKKAIVLVVATICVVCTAVAEQRVGPFLSAMASVGDESGSAFGGGLKYEWLSSQNFGINLVAGYLNDDDMGLIPLEFGPVYVISLDPLAITIGAGGLYGIPDDSDIDAALGFYAATGIRGPVSDGIEWFAELQYVNVKGDDEVSTSRRDFSWGHTVTTITKPSLDFSAVGLNAGILWKF